MTTTSSIKKIIKANIKKHPHLYLDVTSSNREGNFYLIDPNTGKLVGEVSEKNYQKNPGKYTTDEIMQIRRTGWRKSKRKKIKSKRGCGCK